MGGRRTVIAGIALAGPALQYANADTVMPYGEYFTDGAQAANCSVQSNPHNWCFRAGIGDDGDIICTSSWGVQGWIDCWLYTGYNPGSSGYIELATNQPLKSNGHYSLAVCVQGLATAEDQYSTILGYPPSDWPPKSTVWQDQSSQDGAPYPNAYLWFGWQSPIALAPYTAYAIHPFCPPKSPTNP